MAKKTREQDTNEKACKNSNEGEKIEIDDVTQVLMMDEEASKRTLLSAKL
jgi:hypothetical protein